MSETAPLTQPRLVQQIAQRAVKEIPDDFFYQDGFPEAIDAPELWKDKLLIDFSLLSSSSPGGKNELAKMRSALSNYGSFLLINHGIERSLLEEVTKVSKQFFELPLEEKMRNNTRENPLHGYSTDAICKGAKPTNWNDRLFLYNMYPKEEGTLQQWPEKPESFRKVVDEYITKLVTVIQDMYKAMARSLNLEEESFSKFTKKGTVLGRFSIYPRCPVPERVLGSGAHLDGTTVTVILADVEGVQIQNDDQWYKVPIVPGALFVNLGDLMEVMSNGIFKSVMHRVVTNSEQDRISIGAFCGPDITYQIQPASGLVSTHHPALYKKFTVHEYLQTFYQTFPLGLNAIDALKI